MALEEEVPELKNASLQECQARDYSFNRENLEELFEDLLEQNIVTLLQVKCPDEVGRTNNPNIVHTTG